MSRFALALVAAMPLGCSPARDPAAPGTRPGTVLLIRHAEKPSSDSDIHLSPAGQKRAAALPDLFRKSADRPDPFPTPDFIFATKASAHSNRPVETVTPLAKALNLKVQAQYENDEYPKLARELLSDPKYAGKTVLVCWHQGNLPELAARLGATGLPGNWKDSVFDRVWEVTFDVSGNGAPLVKRRQALLPGDETE